MTPVCLQCPRQSECEMQHLLQTMEATIFNCMIPIIKQKGDCAPFITAGWRMIHWSSIIPTISEEMIIDQLELRTTRPTLDRVSLSSVMPLSQDMIV